MKNKILFLILFVFNVSFAQVSLKIDEVNTQFTEVSLPYWLKSGQKVDLGTNVNSVSILEFNLNGGNLEFSQAISLKSAQTVPANKVWKIEALGLKETNSAYPGSSISSASSIGSNETNVPTVYQSPKKFEVPGSYSWIVPPGVSSICVEVWSGGGAGSTGHSGNGTNYGTGGGGGGGGAYVYECFNVLPGTTFQVLVGAGGSPLATKDGGLSKFGELIIVYGGMSGVEGPNKTSIGGQPGYSSNNFMIKGTKGVDGNLNTSLGGSGGQGPNGVLPGNIPGGGGNGGNFGTYSGTAGTPGARGQVYIYW